MGCPKRVEAVHPTAKSKTQRSLRRESRQLGSAQVQAEKAQEKPRKPAGEAGSHQTCVRKFVANFNSRGKPRSGKTGRQTPQEAAEAECMWEPSIRVPGEEEQKAWGATEVGFYNRPENCSDHAGRSVKERPRQRDRTGLHAWHISSGPGSGPA